MSRSTDTGNFYDRVAATFGAYRTGARYQTEFPGESPEGVFERKLIDVGGPEKIALDAGSGDGRFTLAIAQYFGQIVGIDTSRGMLAVAQRRREQGIANARFVCQDAAQTGFADASFDVVYSRRGPTAYADFRRLLKTGGSFLHVGIGEEDALDLKRVFGRGQGFDHLGSTWSGFEQERQRAAGLRIIFVADFRYDEYYASYADLETFLRGVPIFTDFDPETDRAALQAYAAQARTPKGIHLRRHRFVTVAVKNGV